MKMNQPQQEAASHFLGPCMVLAGPGSGKTTVITRRVEILISEYKIAPEQILVVTFTKAAAEEMRRRFLFSIQKQSTEVNFGTFHSIFYKMLRLTENAQADRIAEGEIRFRVLEQALREVHPQIEPDRDFCVGLLQEISYVKNSGVKISDYTPKSPRVDFSAVFRAYNRALQREHAIDFDDMLTETYRMLSENGEALRFWREKSRFILIDEFQDINPIQYEIVKLLAAPLNNLMVVGDDDQSIYGFRGAKPEIMLSFPKTFPRCKTILLDTNYRSGAEIVKRSLSLIGHNKRRFSKKLKAASFAVAEVEKRLFSNEREECEAIAAEIKRTMNRGVPFREIAVLFRTNGGMNTMIQKCVEEQIPFATKDKVPNMFMHFAVKPIFAVLNFVMGNRTRNNFLKFMNCPNRYIKREELVRDEVDLDLLEKRYQVDPARKWMVDKLRFFRYQLKLLGSLGSPFAMINYFRRGMGYDGYVEELAERKNMDSKELLAMLDAVQGTASAYDTIEEWYRFVAEYSRKLEQKTDAVAPVTSSDRITLATLHASKGLEYREVFIVDVNEHVIPHEKSIHDEALEEERRMLYVGMTRAKERLHIYYVKEKFGKQMSPSRFLKEIGG